MNIPFRKFIPGICWFLLVLFLICLPKTDIPNLNGWFHNIHGDKWVHAGMFGVLAWLFIWPFKQSGEISKMQKQKIYLLITLLSIGWGYATECIQICVPGRSYDLLDWAADSAGVIFSFVIMRLRTT